MLTYLVAAVMFFFIFDVPYMMYSLVLSRWRSNGIDAISYIFYVSLIALEATYLLWAIPFVLRQHVW